VLPSPNKVSHSTRLFIALSQVQGRLGEPNSSKLSESLRFPHFTVRWNDRESDGCAGLIVCDPPDRLC
jgi:hypothetical protein